MHAVDALLVVVGIVVVAALGAGVGVAAARRRATPQVVDELRRAVADQQQAADGLLGRLLEANRAQLEQERVRAGQELDGKKELIDHELARVSDQMAHLDRLLRELETDRRQRLGELSAHLERQHEAVSSLHQTTQQLREALASSKVRGQWGERMAEDVLRVAGLVEGVNYHKQRTLTTGGRPDYTFVLPTGQQLHMDVKFPLDNYVRYLECDSDLERHQARDQFLKDVRDRVKELAKRRYLEGDDPTIDCLLLFIPNEGVYAFVQQHDASIADAALREKIVLCSPLTLYAVLAVVRQAVDTFRLEQASQEILELLGRFSDEWQRYTGQLDKVHQRFESVRKEYEALVTTRQRALQRPLDKIEALRREQQPATTGEEGAAPGLAPVAPIALDA